MILILTVAMYRYQQQKRKFFPLGHLTSHNAPINVKPAGGGGRAWGGDLIVFVGPGVGHLTDLVVPGEGIFESFFARL